jgi:hypothetical protein
MTSEALLVVVESVGPARFDLVGDSDPTLNFTTSWGWPSRLGRPVVYFSHAVHLNK